MLEVKLANQNVRHGAWFGCDVGKKLLQCTAMCNMLTLNIMCSKGLFYCSGYGTFLADIASFT